MRTSAIAGVIDSRDSISARFRRHRAGEPLQMPGRGALPASPSSRLFSRSEPWRARARAWSYRRLEDRYVSGRDPLPAFAPRKVLERALTAKSAISGAVFCWRVRETLRAGLPQACLIR